MQLDQILYHGFTIKLSVVTWDDDQKIDVRLESPGGHTSTGQGYTLQAALIAAMVPMILRIEEYLDQVQINFDRAEDALHSRGLVVNGLDLEELDRMRAKQNGAQHQESQ